MNGSSRSGRRVNDTSPAIVDRVDDASTASQHETILALHAERAEIVRRSVVTGSVEVMRKTVERDQLVQEELAREQVEVRRVAIGRVVDEMPLVRQEGDTTIVPVVEEILVTEKRLVLREEIHLLRVRSTELHTETVTLREQQAVITRTTIGDVVGQAASTAVITPDALQQQDA